MAYSSLIKQDICTSELQTYCLPALAFAGVMLKHEIPMNKTSTKGQIANKNRNGIPGV